MATRIKVMKLLQEMKGFAEITNRRPQTRSVGPLMLQLRSSALRAATPKRKRTLTIDVQDRPDIPNPVKITHLRPSPDAARVQPGP